MVSLLRQVARFIHSEDGPTAVEYAVMLGMIFLAAIGSVATLGVTLASKFVIPGW